VIISKTKSSNDKYELSLNLIPAKLGANSTAKSFQFFYFLF
jgi:hypothetical protein